MLEHQSPLKRLLDNLPQKGRLEWIGLRPVRRAAMKSVQECSVTEQCGLHGDHFSGSAGSKRQITLIQYEHLSVIAGCLGIQQILPELLRRNLVVSGINLLAFKEKRFTVGSVILEMTGLCHPCSRMEQTFGDGGYNAVRGHGGITAKVVQGGDMCIGDAVQIQTPT